jgi:hypothetical protein
MQSSGVADRIQVSETTYTKLKDKGYRFEPRGKILIKGKGEMECFILSPECYNFEEDAMVGSPRRTELVRACAHYFEGSRTMSAGMPKESEEVASTTSTHDHISALLS